MFNDPIFLRHKDDVLPFFWPIFVISILMFRSKADRLLANGCQSVGYEVTVYGAVRITDTVYPGTQSRWEDDLFAATGAYGTAGASLGLKLPAPLAAPEIEIACAMNIVLLRRVLGLPGHGTPARLGAGFGTGGRAGRAAVLLAGFPLPST
ncbi:MAG: hypothetical protein AAF253_00490 [Pseudomonadota bacterium]